MLTRIYPTHFAHTAYFQIILASLFIALAAQISIPLIPIPFTGQTLAILLVGATLDKEKGFLSVLLYLIEGCIGLPVFAGGGFGLFTLLGPKGGYLIGFLLQAYLVGWGLEKRLPMLPTLLFACLVQMGLGVFWLIPFTGFKGALAVGFYPFVLGEIAKASLVTLYLKRKY